MDQPPRRASRLVAALNWLLAAASLTNLLQDLGLAALRGKLQMWLNAYDAIVRSTCEFLFSWARNFGADLTRDEGHVLVIASAFLAARARANYPNYVLFKKHGYNNDGISPPSIHPFGRTVGTFIGWLTLFVLAALIPPGKWGFGACLLTLLLLILKDGILQPRMYNFFDYRGWTRPAVAPPVNVWRELVPVLALVLILVVLGSIFNL